MLIHQPLIASKGEQRVEALLQPLQFVGLNIHNRSKFAVAIKPFLVSHRKPHKAHRPQEDQPHLHSEGKGAAQQLPAIVLMLKQSRQ